MLVAGLLGTFVWALQLDRVILTWLALVMLFSHVSMSRRWATAILILRVASNPIASDFILLAFMCSRPYLSYEFRSIFPAFFVPDWVTWLYGGPYFNVAFIVGVALYGLLLFQVRIDSASSLHPKLTRVQVSPEFITKGADTVFMLSAYCVYMFLMAWFLQ